MEPSVRLGHVARIFTDQRLADLCVFCGGEPNTRDHVPPKVLLDKPYPDNLLIVGSCDKCNSGASLDEQFVASILEVATCGTADSTGLRRPNIVRTLIRAPALAEQLARGLRLGDGFLMDVEDVKRLVRVFEKIGRALWAYQTGEPTGQVSASVSWNALQNLTDDDKVAFFAVSDELLPEIGSRMFIRQFEDGLDAWTIVQDDRFAYAVEVLETGGRVKFVVGDYLAGQVDLREEGTGGSSPEQEDRLAGIREQGD